MLSSIEDFGFDNDGLEKALHKAKKKEGMIALITGNHNEIKLSSDLSEVVSELRRESAKDREMIRQILSILENNKK